MLNQTDQLDRMFTALADGNRRAMIDRLSRGDTSVSDMAAPLGISLPAVMQHLAILEDCGLVTSRKVGRVRTCSLDTAALSQAEQWLNQRREYWNQRLDRLGEMLLETSSEKPQNRETKK